MQSNYGDSLNQRIVEGEVVKNFMNAKRIEMGSCDAAARQRSKQDPAIPEPYSKIMKQREEIKQNTNKINCYVDPNEPVFINTMARTMDVYDTRMGTFGGNLAKQKEGKYDKFIQEKRGFIRTSNLYQNTDPKKIVEHEQVPKTSAPGPAFET